jgi:hypothetical protein
VPFVVDLISEWTRGPRGGDPGNIHNDTWLVIQSRDGAHPVAAKLFQDLTSAGASAESDAAQFFTSDRQTWSYWLTGGGYVLDTGKELRRWIEAYPRGDDAFRGRVAGVDFRLRERTSRPFPGKGASWKLPQTRQRDAA